MDGFIARKTKTTSRLGEKLDTIADMVMTGVLLVVIYPIVNIETKIFIWIILIGFIRIASMVVIFKKYKTFAMLHSYGNKITGIVIYIFPILIPLIQTTVLMHIICLVATISAIEELIINRASKELEVNIKSILTK